MPETLHVKSGNMSKSFLADTDRNDLLAFVSKAKVFLPDKLA